MEINKNIFEPALGIKEPFYISEFEVDNKELKINIYIDFRKGYKFRFPGDKRIKKTAHDTIYKVWRHLDFWNYKTYIYARVPRIKNKKEIKMIDVPWAEKNSGLTIEFQKVLISFSKHMSIKQIENHFKIRDTRIWRILKKRTNEIMKNQNFENTVRIGVDETSRKKGHNYITTFMDLDTKRIIYIKKGKDSSVFHSFKEYFTKHKGKCKNIKEVSIDMSSAFIKGIREVLPNARITFDRFHIIKKINKQIDEVRKEESETNTALKNTKYLWLKNINNLNKKELKIFKKIEDVKWKTKRAYEYKLSFNSIFTLPGNEAIVKFQDWIEEIENDDIEPMKQAAKTIKNYLDGIMSWFDSRINNGLLEGTNSMIQLFKRRARGFKNTDYFKKIIYLNYG